jgi:hypothetical protein
MKTQESIKKLKFLPYPIFKSRFTVLGKIGAGGFGKIYEIKDKLNNK